MTQLTTADPRFGESPTVWFSILEAAVRQQDYDRAAKAKRELQRLGIDVRFGTPQQGGRARAN